MTFDTVKSAVGMVNIAMSQYPAITWWAKWQVIGWVPDSSCSWFQLTGEELVEGLKLIWVRDKQLIEVNTTPSLSAAKIEVLSEMWGKP